VLAVLKRLGWHDRSGKGRRRTIFGMSTKTPQADGHSTVITYDNHLMTEPAASPSRHMIEAPFTKRTWSELGHALASFPLTIAALLFIVPMLENGALWAASTAGVRKLGAAARALARAQLGEDIPDPPPLRQAHFVKVASPDAAAVIGFAQAVAAAGGKARPWESSPGVTTRWLPLPRVAELAAEAGIPANCVRPRNELANWFGSRILDPVAWRARGYFALKLPLGAISLGVIAACWLGGVFLLTFPAWRTLGLGFTSLAGSFTFIPLGVVLLLAAPWVTHGLTEADLWLMRGLLGPGSSAARIRVLEQSRARVVDDSAARLRGIERDLHDGTQAQLVALAMKLGLAREKLQGDGGADLARVTQLVEDAHRGALEAIADLRTLARGIHPPVLDNGLADALTTLANRSAVPVELVTDIPERPSAAIETIAYFSAAELLANVAKHSGARHATLEAVHVPGLLRIRVTDDGVGGARPVPNGGLRGLAERVRTVDGRIEVVSPQGGPTTVTVELPSHA
jgi:signal transduction histidine kinase